MDTSKTNKLPASEQTVTTTREVPPSSSRKKGPAPSIPKPDSTVSPATQPEVNRPCPEHNFLTDVWVATFMSTSTKNYVFSIYICSEWFPSNNFR